MFSVFCVVSPPASIQKDRRHHARRERVGGGEVDVLATPELTVARTRGRVRREARLRTAGESRRERLTRGGLGAKAAHGSELGGAELGVEKVFDVDRDVEPAMAIAD